MDRNQSTRVFFVPRPNSVRWSNQVTPSNIHKNHWTPSEQDRSSYPSSILTDSNIPWLDRYSRNTNTASINNEKTKCSNVLLICVGVTLFLIALAALIISIYLLILTNKTTTTTNSTTSASTVCVNGDTLATFDTLTQSIAVPNGYKDITWTNAYTYTASTNTTGYYIGIVSPPNIIYNGNANPVTIQTATGRFFTLSSAAMTAAWYDNLQVTIVGYRSSAVIATQTYTLQVYTVSYLTFTGYSGLDTVIFSTSGGTQNAVVNGSGRFFAMDNMCLSFA